MNTAGLETEPDCVRPSLEELERSKIALLTLPINDRASVGIKEHFPSSGAWIVAWVKLRGINQQYPI